MENKRVNLHTLIKIAIIISLVFEINILKSCKEDKNDVRNQYFQDSLAVIPLVDHIGSVADINNKLIRVTEFGDTIAYNELSVAYFMANELRSLYYYSLIMANKYGYGKAYLDLYLALREPFNGKGFQSVDPKTKRLAIFYLLKSMELGNETAKWEAQEIFSGETIPLSSEYNLID